MKTNMNKQTRGTMVLSLDLELSWGRFYRLPIDFLTAESIEERTHIKRFLALLDHYEIPATWAMVGHLMLDGCARDHNGNAHSDVMPHARYSWFPHDWYSYDPCTRASHAPGWYAPDILEWIRGTRIRHEIGSHSFSHIDFGDPECSSSVAEADLKAAVDTAARRGIALKSFIFPRNHIGHLELLRKSGISAFRGLDAPPVSKGYGIFIKPFNLMTQLLCLPMKPVRAEEVLPGLWNIPGNHFFLPRSGIRKILPRGGQALRAKRCIDKAVKSGGIYHMWFHPFDLNTDTEAMFLGLEDTFAYARRMREKGLLDILTMGEYAESLEKEKLTVPRFQPGEDSIDTDELRGRTVAQVRGFTRDPS